MARISHAPPARVAFFISHPHRDRRALSDVTRELTPEEMAELQLEQGYVERALRIYDELVAGDPANAGYATRRAWLARMVPPQRADERTLRGLGPAGAGSAIVRPIVPVR